MKNTHFAQTPLFWGHGTADPLVPFSRAETSGRCSFFSSKEHALMMNLLYS